MTEPVIAQKSPFMQELEPGTYTWCACGRSANQPFCDGSHQGTGITPVQFTVSEKTQLALCGCKHTRTPPYCDGTHQHLQDDMNRIRERIRNTS
ncbi:MAG: CDGSH iron-sulfur domain-containing protein [Gammaproteobacteria bacterium]|nr:CDGSH iron-sulfur domain-containing protein [Gammaproteobacteria bacterium]